MASHHVSAGDAADDGGAAMSTMAHVLSAIEEQASRPGEGTPGAFRTGFEVLDQVLEGGIRLGDLTLVGGPPGVGKTVATMQWARTVAMSGFPAIYASYEHDERSMFSRVLLMEVGFLPNQDRAHGLGDLRRTVRSISRSERSLREEMAGNLPLRAACAHVAGYEDHLSLVRAGARIGLPELEKMVTARGPGPVALFVDYLQKVPADGDSDQRTLRTAEGLKEIALQHDAAVVAVVAGDESGLAQRRLRLRNIRGAAELAYEADVVMMLNEKSTAVSRIHSAYDPMAAERFKRQVVLTIEKNRDGPASIDVEFNKDFEHFRFDPEGSAVEERLSEDNLPRS